MTEEEQPTLRELILRAAETFGKPGGRLRNDWRKAIRAIQEHPHFDSPRSRLGQALPGLDRLSNAARRKGASDLVGDVLATVLVSQFLEPSAASELHQQTASTLARSFDGHWLHSSKGSRYIFLQEIVAAEWLLHGDELDVPEELVNVNRPVAQIDRTSRQDLEDLEARAVAAQRDHWPRETAFDRGLEFFFGSRRRISAAIIASVAFVGTGGPIAADKKVEDQLRSRVVPMSRTYGLFGQVQEGHLTVEGTPPTQWNLWHYPSRYVTSPNVRATLDVASTPAEGELRISVELVTDLPGPYDDQIKQLEVTDGLFHEVPGVVSEGAEPSSGFEEQNEIALDCGRWGAQRKRLVVDMVDHDVVPSVVFSTAAEVYVRGCEVEFAVAELRNLELVAGRNLENVADDYGGSLFD